ncbi:MAG: T9SS type A sorting domain-containing protein [Sphingobacteriales bacterium]|nr:MAG: T9SS type A sorting domain-containing protein [Sphingobacteriales bacterium]
MKKIFTSVAVMASFNSFAQVATFENTYNSTSYSVETLEGEGQKYAIITGSRISVYNVDHSLYKEINTGLPGPFSRPFYTIYLSKNLFNADNKVEALVTVNNGTTTKSYIVDEDGKTLQTFEDASSCQVKNVNGKAMLLVVKQTKGTTDVYSLPGTYTGLKPEAREASQTSIYPNPVETVAKITYKLPEGQRQANLNIYNSAGVLVKQMIVTDQFNDVLIQRGDLPAGSYIYRVCDKVRSFVVN